MIRRWRSWLGVYTGLIYCAVPFAFAVVLWRGLRDRGYWQGLGERFGFGSRAGGTGAGAGTEGGAAIEGGAGTIWLHAVSLGEMSAAAPLVRALRERYPQSALLLTTATPTGRERARSLFGDAVDVRFLPYDMPGAVRRFLERVRPRLALMMETEIWPNLYLECERGGVPLVLASARLSAKSVARYQRFGGVFRGLFSASSLIAAQTELDAERFVAIGAQSARICVAGNIKFDLELGAGVPERGRELRTRLGTFRPVWVAGSTHAGEEEQVLAAHTELLRVQPDALLLLVPRHPDRFDAVAGLLNRRGLRFTRRSGGVIPDAATPVMLGDTVGELAVLYASADVAFVGGSLLPIGGHNLLEPAALGVPVLTGPSHSNAKDIATLLLAQGAALQVADARELAAALSRLFGDPAQRQRMGAIGRRAVESNRGSVARLLELIEALLAQESSPRALPR
jgi:3-deoxy-D-manno-octulosonic-acid transferase